MAMHHPMEVLFLTSFSDYCFRCIPAIAQMADLLKVRLTILHAYDPAKIGHTAAEAQLKSFFPEADRYAACQRLAVPGPLVDVVTRHVQAWPVDLIVAPASDAVGLPRVGMRSSRRRLIEATGVPVWTLGRGTASRKLQQPVQNVACWLDFHASGSSHLAYAIEYSKKFRARLHLMQSLPEIDDGLLGLDMKNGKPLSPNLAAAEILNLCANAPLRPEIHVSRGDRSTERTRMLRECDADVVFLRTEPQGMTDWLGLGMWSCDNLPCPAVCIGERLKSPVWNLASGNAMHEELSRPRLRLGGGSSELLRHVLH